MNRKIALRWARALESGEYKQGRGQLRTKDNRFCCLGVLCNLHAQDHPKLASREKSVDEYMDHSAVLPDSVKNWAGMNNSQGIVRDAVLARRASGSVVESLTEMNDCGKFTFQDIAAAIRKHSAKL